MTNSNFQVVSFKELDGLITEINEIMIPPNSLADCRNVIATREGKLEARPAFPVIWDIPPPNGNNSNFSPDSIFYIPNSDNSFIFTYKNTAFSDDIGNFADSINFVFNTARFIVDDIEYSNFIGVEYLKPIFSWGSSLSIKSFLDSNTISVYNNIYLNSANGLFRTTDSAITNITTTNYNKFKKINVPLLKSFNVRLSLSTEMTDADRWFKSGFAVDVVAILNEAINVNQTFEGKPTRINKVINIGPTGALFVNIIAIDINIKLLQGFVEVYRTLQYDPSTAAPTIYYKCYEAELTSGTIIPPGTFSFQSLLNLNDDTIQFNNEQLYTSLNQLGPSNVNSAIPVAKEFLIHQGNAAGDAGYAVYANIMRPPFASLVFTALPANGVDKLKIGATNVTLSYTNNSTTAPANNGVIDLTTGTFRGNSNNGGSHYNLIIKAINATVDGPSNDFSVPFYAVGKSITLTNPANDTNDITITPQPNMLFDIAKFSKDGGVVAIVKSDSGVPNNVVAIFSYQTYEANTSSGTWTFKSCSSAGVPFSAWSFTTGNLYLYVLDVSTFTTIPVYASAVNSSGFSILPTFEKYPVRPFNNIPVGRCSEFFNSSNYVVADIEFFGVYNQSASQQLDETAKNFTDSYNANRIPEDPYIDYDPLSLGKITIISQYSGYNPTSLYTANTLYNSGTGFYDQINASINSGAMVKFDKFLSTTPINIMEEEPQVISGITFSRLGSPESCPLQQVISPLLVGSPLNSIQKAVSIYDKLFVFKKDEGTYRIILEGGSIIASVSSQQLIDNTSWLLIDNSVQAWEEGAIFFSNRAFCFINGNGDVTPISTNIEKELLNFYEVMKDKNILEDVQSFIIPNKRIYGCYFPNINVDGTGIIFVYNMFKKRWTVWNTEILSVTVKPNGQLTFFYPMWNFQSGYQYNSDYELKILPIDYGNKRWVILRQSTSIQNFPNQVDEQIPLTLASITLLNNTYEIAGAGGTTSYQRIYEYFVTMKNKDVYYYSASNGLIWLEIISTNFDVSIKFKPKDPNVFLPTPNNQKDKLIGGVDTEIYMNKFYSSPPEGGGLSHFNEIQGLIGEGKSITNLQFIFFGNGIIENLVIDNDGNLVTDNDGNLVVTTIGTFFDESIVFLIPLVNNYFRTYLPINVMRGRYLQFAIRHASPYQIFSLCSIVFKYKDVRSIKSKILDGAI